MEESNYWRWQLPPGVGTLLTLAGLPLIDGFFLTFVTTDLWRDPWRDLAFGLTAFSGAGCVIAAMQLKGSPGWRAVQVIGVYAVVAAGAVAVSMGRSLFQALLPPNLHLFTATFLLGLGLWISGVPFLGRVANWMGFQAAVKAMVAASLIHGLIAGVPWGFSLTPELWLPLAIAVGAGLSLSMAGMVLGLLLNRAADQRPLNLGAGISLMAMGLSVLGVGIPSIWVIAPLAIGCLWSAGASVYQAALRRLPHLDAYLESG